MKRFVFGLILGAGLMLGFSAQAEVVSYIGKVIEGQFPVKVDGKTLDVPGIVVDGTTYLPVRALGELLGYNVSFNAEMGVELSKKTIEPVPKAGDEKSVKERVQWLDEKINSLRQSIKENEEKSNDPSLNESAKKMYIEANILMESKIREFQVERATLTGEDIPVFDNKPSIPSPDIDKQKLNMEEIRTKINGINQQIEVYRISIAQTEKMIERQQNQENIAKLKSDINKQRQLINELEAEKAELEAQPNAQ